MRSALAHFAHLRLLALSADSGAFGGYGGAQPKSSVLGLSLIDDAGMHLLDYFGGEIATYKRRYSAPMEHAFVLLEDLLSRFHTLAETDDFQFVVLVIPTASQIDNELRMFRWPDPWGTIRRRGYDLSQDDLDFVPAGIEYLDTDMTQAVWPGCMQCYQTCNPSSLAYEIIIR